eukprot:58485-Rhodomonas_salina.1
MPGARIHTAHRRLGCAARAVVCMALWPGPRYAPTHISLRASYRMSGTDVAYGAISLRALRCPEHGDWGSWSYERRSGATKRAVLKAGMVLPELLLAASWLVLFLCGTGQYYAAKSMAKTPMPGTNGTESGSTRHLFCRVRGTELAYGAT